MSKVINTVYKPNKSFWEENEHLFWVDEFNDFYKEDRSKNKEKSSKIMWAIHFIYDYKSRFAHLPIEDRPKQAKRILKLTDSENKKLFSEDEKINKLIEAYMSLQEEAPIRYLRSWEKAVHKRTRLLEDLDFTEEADKADKILLNSSKILEEGKKIAQLVKEQEDGRVRGDQKISLNARGLLNVIKEDGN